MENSKWLISNNKASNELKNLNIDNDILKILLNRSINTKDQIIKFLNPSLEQISDPLLLSDVDKSSDKIIDYINTNKRICIYGDYDVDGISSTSLFIMSLRNLGYETDYYIPLRDEGYGLNKKAIKSIKDDGTDLLITVDCGISSVEEVAYANEIGLEVIITDHHSINNELPPAFAVINPKRNDNKYKFDALAGVGTAFMLIYAIYIKLNKRDEVFQFLDIVAIGTVADIVPLKEENRIFVKFGLKLLNETKNVGLRALLKIIFEDYTSHKFIGSDVGYRIAPVFNASGRLDDAKQSVVLLTTSSSIEANVIANDLISQNIERKNIQANILELVEKQILDKKLNDNNAIISYDTGFHHGIIGIVASKIVDKYYKPTIILEIKEDGNAVASARSIEGFNIVEALDKTKDLLLKYGGHAAAAGFTIKADNLPEFSKKFNQLVGEVLNEEDFIKPIKIDKEIFFNKISYEFYNKLDELSPFGCGNPKPVFKAQNIDLSNIRKIGKNKDHIMFDINKNKITIKNCVWFNKGHHFNAMSKNEQFDLVFKMDSSIFKDKFYVKVFAEDLKVSTNDKENKLIFYTELYNTIFPLKSIFYSKMPLDKSLALSIDFNSTYNNLTVLQRNKIVGFLSSELSFLLKFLNSSYNINFDLKIESLERTDSTHIVKILINKSFEFKTLAYNSSGIFKEIKSFLIGDFNYNSIQKKTLKSLFHDKQNTLLISKFARGINTIILTAALYYYKIDGVKSLLVTDNKEILPDIIFNYFDVSSEYKKDNYKFVTFYNKLPNDNLEELTFVFSDNNIDLNNFIKLEDKYEVSNNIKIIGEEKFLASYDLDKIYFSKKLPISEKKNVINSINQNKEIISTIDILAYL